MSPGDEAGVLEDVERRLVIPEHVRRESESELRGAAASVSPLEPGRRVRAEIEARVKSTAITAINDGHGAAVLVQSCGVLASLQSES